MEDYLRAIIEPLLSDKSNITITRTSDDRGVLLSVGGISKYEFGRVIGKEGVTIKAIRLLLHVWGTQNGAVISVKILEPEGGKYANGTN